MDDKSGFYLFSRDKVGNWYRCRKCGLLERYQKHKKPVEEVNPFCRKCGAIMDRSVIFMR